MRTFIFLALAIPSVIFAREDLFDRNESQQDFNPYDYPSNIQPNNTQSIYYPESQRLEQWRQQQGYNQDGQNQQNNYYYQQR
jgi:hypothetical protein